MGIKSFGRLVEVRSIQTKKGDSCIDWRGEIKCRQDESKQAGGIVAPERRHYGSRASFPLSQLYLIRHNLCAYLSRYAGSGCLTRIASYGRNVVTQQECTCR